MAAELPGLRVWGATFPPRTTYAPARGVPPVRSRPAWYLDALAVFGLALGLRLMFSLLMANTFDGDEFVYLALGHDVGHGAVPYRDFAFYHPPGILVLLGALNPMTALWWPLARLCDVAIDSGTALLVWRLGAHLFGRRPALAAGVLYAVSPIALISGVRVDQEVSITALAMLGLTLLVVRDSQRTAVVAGLCLAAACWIKYPMAVFLPVYLLAAPRRAVPCVFGLSGGVLVLFAPYLGHLGQLYDDTVAWQMVHRPANPLPDRLLTTLIFWLVINPLAVLAMWRGRAPRWLMLAFATGGIFIATSSVYPHYFTPVAPFAALLGAPLAVRYLRVPRRVVVLCCVSFTVAWAVFIGLVTGERGFVLAERFADLHPVVRLIDRTTSPNTPVLASRPEYAYLAHRPWVAHYFWNDHQMVSAQRLEQRLPGRSVVIWRDLQTDRLAYPNGFLSYLRRHAGARQIDNTAVWFLAQQRGGRR